MAEAIEARVRAIAEPIAEAMGLAVLEVRFSGGRQAVLQVIVDAAGGVDIDRLEELHRALSLELDIEDPIAGSYRLEVSSPGLDWPLATAADLARHIGERLKVVLADGRTLCGMNLGPRDDELLALRLDDGREMTIALAEARRIVREPEMPSKPKRRSRR